MQQSWCQAPCGALGHTLAKWMKIYHWHCSQGEHVKAPGGGHVVVAGTGGPGLVPLTNCED